MTEEQKGNGPPAEDTSRASALRSARTAPDLSAKKLSFKATSSNEEAPDESDEAFLARGRRQSTQDLEGVGGSSDELGALMRPASSSSLGGRFAKAGTSVGGERY